MSRSRDMANLGSVTATVDELNKLDGFTGVVADLNYAKDLKATGVTNTEFDYLDGVTSNIQTQFTVTDITSSFVSVGSPWIGWETNKCYKFLDFIFVQLSAYATASTLATTENFIQITNSDYYPSYNVSIPTINHEGDTASQVKISANQQYIQVKDIYNQGDGVFRVSVNGWYYVG